MGCPNLGVRSRFSASLVGWVGSKGDCGGHSNPRCPCSPSWGGPRGGWGESAGVCPEGGEAGSRTRRVDEGERGVRGDGVRPNLDDFAATARCRAREAPIGPFPVLCFPTILSGSVVGNYPSR